MAETSSYIIEPEKRGFGETVTCDAPILPITDSPIPKLTFIKVYNYFNDHYQTIFGLIGFILICAPFLQIIATKLCF